MAEGQDQKIAPEEATKKILEQADKDLSADEQAKLGKPLKDETGISQEDQQFLQMLVDKIEKKEIDLHVPSSLLNVPVYSKLDEEARGKADLNAMNLLSTIRQIYTLWQSGDHETYQIQNLVHQIRITKERLEEVGGDIYII